MTKFTPRPYQGLIIDRILGQKRTAIWAGMGLGKTVSTLTAVKLLLDYYCDGPVLVLAPKRVAQSTWPDEVCKWEHLSTLRVTTAVGGLANIRKGLEANDSKPKEGVFNWDILCANYESIPTLVQFFGRAWPFKIIVADESTKLKGFRLHSGTQRARELARVAHQFTDRFIELTGTPAPNGYEDLWGQMWFIDKGERLGTSMSAFLGRWFRPIRVGDTPQAVRWDLLPGADADIQQTVKDAVLKINTEDWFDISQPIVKRVEVELPAKAREQYNQMRDEMYVELEEGASVESPNAAAKIGRCLQMAGGAIYVPEEMIDNGQGTPTGYIGMHGEKITALKDVIEEAAGAPVLVAYQFRHEAQRICDAIRGVKLLDSNPQTIRDWNAGKIPVLLAHPASCGHGLNLQDGGNILVFFSQGWNLEEHLQIIERIGPTRQMQSGHPRPVYIVKIIAKNTVDEAVELRLEKKCSVMDALLEKKGLEND